MHAAVPAAIEPREEARLRVAEVGAGDPHLLEPELATPRLDPSRELRRIRTFESRVRMHITDGNRSIPPLTGHLGDEAATWALGAALAAALEPGLVLYLQGDLGAGKTTLVRACLLSLGCREKVKSPSYTLVELYPLSSLDFYHFDFYRFKSPGDWDAAGFREYFDTAAVCAVEWPERAGARLPGPDLRIRLGLPAHGRTFEIAAESERGVRCLSRLRESMARSRPLPGGSA